MKNKAGILFLKVILLSSPILILLVSYIYYDPFRVLHHYSNFEKDCFVGLNRDFVGTEVYFQNNKKQQYNAFIFGNSRSMSFLCSDWKQYIPNASPFHYDASSESLKALCEKFKFMDEHHQKLDYALIVLDKEILELTGYISGPLYQPHPTISKTSWITFHVSYFKSYLSEFYFIKYSDYYYTRNFRPYMKGVIETRPIDYNPVTNDFYLKVYDDELNRDPQAYIKKHAAFYTPRDTVHTVYANNIIGEKQIVFLHEMEKVLSKHHTQFKIVLSPAYDQVYFNKADLAKLDSIFGEQNVYDFSGRNEYTRNIENYYESFHYRPKVARDILKKIYAEH